MTVERCDAACFDCGLLYADLGFVDLVLPNDVWAKIAPSHDGGGLLCPTCICARTQKAGIECVAMWRSGPFANQDDALSKMIARAKAAEAEVARLVNDVVQAGIDEIMLRSNFAKVAAELASLRASLPGCTARQIIETRLGRPLGPLATMPRDLRTAIYKLALHLQRMKE